jgi:hypothetical protein
MSDFDVEWFVRRVLPERPDGVRHARQRLSPAGGILHPASSWRKFRGEAKRSLPAIRARSPHPPLSLVSTALHPVRRHLRRSLPLRAVSVVVESVGLRLISMSLTAHRVDPETRCSGWHHDKVGKSIPLDLRQHSKAASVGQVTMA